jgi:hypothetical protein
MRYSIGLPVRFYVVWNRLICCDAQRIVHHNIVQCN